MLPNETSKEEKQQLPQENQPSNVEKEVLVKENSKKKFLFLMILILAIGIATYFFFFQKPTTTTSTITTTISSQLSYISSCANISVPGIYYLKNDIEFNKASACITIKTTNVKIFGNGHTIKGNGPYLNVSPFSYGILINSSNNVVVSNLTITNFSYGIFVINSSKVEIDANLKHNVLSSLMLQNSKSINFTGNISSTTIFGIQLKNSSNINIKGNILGSGIYDLKCDYSSGLFLSNSLFNGGCANNSGCEFASCRKNYPINLESLSQKIEGCGIIDKPGNYLVSNNIFVSNISRFGISCLQVKVSNVSIDLNNKTIVGNGASTAIQILNVNKVGIRNGILQKNNIAINISGSSNINLENIQIKDNKEGIVLNNSNANNFKNLKILKNGVGVKIYSSLGNNFYNFSSYNNTIGFQLEKYSFGNFFEKGNSKNTGLDFSCDNSSSGSYLNTFSSSSCSVGNCLWANCTKILLPYQKSTKINSCGTISSPGNYSLSNNLVTSSSCIQILSNNVNFSCAGFSIQGNGVGNGIFINGNNVTLTNCKISNFEKSIYAKNLKSLNIDTVSAGKIILENVGFSSFSNITASDFIANKLYNSKFYSSDLAHKIVISNSFILNNSKSNEIIFTNAKKILFLNQSENNSIAASSFGDVICDPSTNSINKNNGISTCASKSCTWFVCTSSLPSPCQSIRGYLSLFSDYVISAPVCFTVLSNDSTLDCNGHILFGNFQNTLVFVNASRFTMKNCNVKNFSTVAKVLGNSLSFYDLNISSSLSSIIGKTSNSLFENISIFSSPNITISGSNNIFKNILVK